MTMKKTTTTKDDNDNDDDDDDCSFYSQCHHLHVISMDPCSVLSGGSIFEQYHNVVVYLPTYHC